MVSVEKLKATIEAHNLTVQEVADNIGIDRSTFYRKLSRNDSSFTVEQAKNISTLLRLTAAEFQAIFFAE